MSRGRRARLGLRRRRHGPSLQTGGAAGRARDARRAAAGFFERAGALDNGRRIV
jgi:hypothetical protein